MRWHERERMSGFELRLRCRLFSGPEGKGFPEIPKAGGFLFFPEHRKLFLLKPCRNRAILTKYRCVERAHPIISVRKKADFMKRENRITVICGHYGCGKTNLTLNLALQAAEVGEKVTVVDVDVVNPYFRSSEYRELLEGKGIRVISPVFAGTTLDTPTLPPELASIFEPGSGHVFIDAGGDDAGVTALGGFHELLDQAGYEMLYVINRYRVLSQTPEEACTLLREIEVASRLTATGIVNNSHLGVETTAETLTSALPFAEKTAELTGLPLLYSTAPSFVYEGKEPPAGFRKIRRLVKFFWEE